MSDASAQRVAAEHRPSASGAGEGRATAVLFGDSARIGGGRVRSYVTIDRATNAAIEIGVAFSAHLLAKRTATDPAVRDEILELPVPKRYQEPGAYPTAYRITWDADAGEYRVALTRLVARR